MKRCQQEITGFRNERQKHRQLYDISEVRLSRLVLSWKWLESTGVDKNSDTGNSTFNSNRIVSQWDKARGGGGWGKRHCNSEVYSSPKPSVKVLGRQQDSQAFSTWNYKRSDTIETGGRYSTVWCPVWGRSWVARAEENMEIVGH